MTDRLTSSQSRKRLITMPKIDFGAILTPRHRGILLDGVVLLFNLSLMWIITRLSLNLVQQAEEDWLAKLAIGLFFAGLLFLQPLGQFRVQPSGCCQL